MTDSAKTKPYSERSFVLAMTWLTAAASAFLLAAVLGGYRGLFVEMAAAITASAFFLMPFAYFYDDYHKSLQNKGLRWAALPFALWLFHTGVQDGASASLAEPIVALAIIAFTYHAGFVFARVRGGYG